MITEEQKELLLKDICARLPYNVWVSYKTKYDDIERATILNGNYVRDIMEDTSSWIDFKPYLRPMSSMTEEERKSLPFPWNFDGINITSYTEENGFIEIQQTDIIELTDWLNKKMFDWRGLIPADCAIEVKEDNNPYKD